MNEWRANKGLSEKRRDAPNMSCCPICQDGVLLVYVYNCLGTTIGGRPKPFTRGYAMICRARETQHDPGHVHLMDQRAIN